MIKSTPSEKDTEIKKQVAKKPADDIIDVDLSAIKRKRFRINGDNNMIIELNTSDMNIISRISEVKPKLEALQKKAAELSNSDDSNTLESSAKLLSEIDHEMRDLVDYIFNSDISSKCAADGSMYDPLDGNFRYEHIIDKLMKLYEDNLVEEYKKMKLRVNKYAKTTSYKPKKK